jgi:hypothetical protein
MAGTTGLEPATSAVTGQRSNQLSYVPKLFFNNMDIGGISIALFHLLPALARSARQQDQVYQNASRL